MVFWFSCFGTGLSLLAIFRRKGQPAKNELKQACLIPVGRLAAPSLAQNFGAEIFKQLIF